MKLQNTLIIIIVILIGVIIIQHKLLNRNSKFIETPTIVKVTDTFWSVRDTAINKIVFPTRQHKNSPPKVKEKLILDNVSFDSLKSIYLELLNKYYVSSIYKDTIKIDSSFVYIEDSVQQNLILSRVVNTRMKYPLIKETIVKTVPQTGHTRLFLSTGIQYSKDFQQLNLGLMVQSKNFKPILNVSTGINTLGKPSVGLTTYWKIN